jgi:hypothetical protein
VEDQEDRTRRHDGSAPVEEHPPESPGPGRSTVQYLVIGLAVLILLAAVLWLVLPLSAG